MRRLLTTLRFGATAVGLIATNIVLAERPVDISPMRSAQGTGVQLSGPAEGNMVAPDVVGLSETFERPLFNQTRRKFIPAPAEQKSVDVAPSADTTLSEPQETLAATIVPSLLGISINGEVARALLQPKGDAAVWYANGEIFDGWSVSVINKDEAMLKRDGHETRLSLYPQTQKLAVGDAGIAQ